MTLSHPSSVQQALISAQQQLPNSNHGDPRLEAEILLAHALNKPRSYLFAWPDKNLKKQELSQFQSLLQRRCQGEPIAYLTGMREFWSLEFAVTPATLIPRPETELLVERALASIPIDGSWQIADLGTGCGAIAAVIAKERPNCQVIACDRSEQALKVARANFDRLGLHQVITAAGKWYDALPQAQRFGLILSNPPYVASDSPYLQRGDLRWEPTGALTAGPEGLEAIRIIVHQAPEFLLPDGGLILEHGHDQGQAVRGLMGQAGFGQIQTHVDHSGHERVTEGHRLNRAD